MSWAPSRGQGGSLDEGVATHSSILVWRIPWTEEPAGHNPWVAESDTTEWLSSCARTHASWGLGDKRIMAAKGTRNFGKQCLPANSKAIDEKKMHTSTVFSLVKLFSRRASSEMAQHVTGVERMREGCGHRFLTVGRTWRQAGEEGGTHPVKQNDREAQFSGHSCLTPCVQAGYMSYVISNMCPGSPAV